MSRWRRVLLVAMVAGAMIGMTDVPRAAAVPTGAKWVGTWSSAQVQPDTVPPSSTGFADQTLRQIVHTSIGGSEVRLRLSDAYGNTSPSGASPGGSILDLARSSAATPAAAYNITAGLPPLVGNPVPFTDPQSDQEQVFGITQAGQLVEVYRNVTTFALATYNLSAATPATPPLVGDPVPFVDPQTGAEQILARAADGHLIDVARDRYDGGLTTYDLTDMTPGHPLVVADPVPFRDPQTGAEQIFATSAAGHLIVIARDSATFGLTLYDLNINAGSGVTVAGVPAPIVDPQTGQEQIDVRGTSGAIIDFARHPNFSIGVYDISPPGTPPLASDPVPFRDPQSAQEQIFGVSATGDLFEVYRNTTTLAVSPYDLSAATPASLPVAGRPAPFVDPQGGNEEIFARTLGGDVTAFDRAPNGVLTPADLTQQSGYQVTATGDPLPYSDPQIAGEQVEVATNPAGPAVAVSAAFVGARQSGATLVPGTNVAITVDGSTSFVLPPGETIETDPVPLAVTPDSDLAVSLYFAAPTGPATFHPTALTTNYIAGGDQAATYAAGPFTTTTESWYFLAGVDVLAPPTTDAVVAFGASSTDGVGSTPDANERWTNDLYRRIEASGQGATEAVLDSGIAGNRLLTDGGTSGRSGEERFAADAIDQPGVGVVIVSSLANNDIGLDTGPAGQPVSAADIIAGYQTLIAQAHAAGLKIIGGTVTPDQGAGYFTAAGEAKREAVNDWILTSGAFDGTVDFATAVADPSDPERLLPAYDSGDHLHPNDAGYQAMANAVNLSLLQTLAP